MSKRDVCLVFGITENYVFALANTLIGLVKHNKNFWDNIIIYHNGVSKEDIERINKIVKCEFIKIKKDSFTSYISREELKKYSEACFYRYNCFKLLDEYKTVIWNDVDILIQDDISSLTKYAQKTGFSATYSSVGFNNESNFKKLILDYNMFTPLINSGIIVLSDKLPNYELMYDWCMRKTAEYGHILRWPDQGIINLLVQEFKIEMEPINIEKYCCHPSKEDKIKSAAIIHAYGDKKFWNDIELINNFNEWSDNNITWNNICNKDSKSLPLVSVIMSVYNRFEFLTDSITSILRQTYANFEFIIVLDPSENTDKIIKIIEKYNDKRIKIIKNKNKIGFANSLNVAIESSKGKYIARMDDDDISYPQRFAKQVQFLENNPKYGICGTGAKFFGTNNDIIKVETDSEKNKIITLFRTPFVHPTVMMNKELLDKYNLRYDANYFTEDYELWSRAVSCFPVSNINEILLKYRSSKVALTSGENELKIHDSHKRIMDYQLKKYLRLELTDNEIEVLQGRKDNLLVCNNYEEVKKLKELTIKKVIMQNNIIKFYNQEKLFKILNTENNNKGFKSLIKKIIKKILRPFYNSLMYRVENLIDNHDKKIYEYVDKKIEKQEKKG